MIKTQAAIYSKDGALVDMFEWPGFPQLGKRGQPIGLYAYVCKMAAEEMAKFGSFEMQIRNVENENA